MLWWRALTQEQMEWKHLALLVSRHSSAWKTVVAGVEYFPAPKHRSAPVSPHKLLLASGAMLQSTCVCLRDLWQLGQPSVQAFQ